MNKPEKKIIKKDVKKILKQEVGTAAGKAHRAKLRGRDAKRAIQVVHKQAKGGTLSRNPAAMFHRAFTDRDAARLAWMLTVCDPFGKHHWAVPPTMGLGVPLAAPRIYRITMRGFAEANVLGRVYIGANADMWLADPTRATLTNAQPRYGFLGNSVVNGVGNQRGAPVHHTISTYAGCAAATPVIAGSNGYSYPAPSVTAATGLVFTPFPDDFISVQLGGSPTSGDAYQRAQNIAVGLRVRPTAPASGALIPQGVIIMTQQTLGDTVITNAAAANSPTSTGGVDAYSYVSSLFGGPAADELTDEMLARLEWDVMDWPKEKGARGTTWLTAAAIPNQSCALAAYAPKTVGDRIVGFPQLAALGAGMLQGQVVEWEASYIYAFYGGVSYEINAHRGSSAVPAADLTATASAAADHMQLGSPHSPARQAVAATVQPSVSAGDVSSKSASQWLGTGKQVIETATGSTIGELLGEGLGFLGAMLF